MSRGILKVVSRTTRPAILMRPRNLTLLLWRPQMLQGCFSLNARVVAAWNRAGYWECQCPKPKRVQDILPEARKTVSSILSL